jgi:ATP diphosphatase
MPAADDTARPAPAATGRIEDLIDVMAALRTPVTGCPWDLEQTFATIAPYTIEEAYEVADAIERGDHADLKEELGDLLLQVVYHARIAEEGGRFAFADVVRGITAKMVRRHPHVFGDAAARSAGAAKGFWEAIKAEEKIAKASERARLNPGREAPGTPVASLLDDVPKGMAALSRAVKLQDKAARVGFDWPSLGPVFDKMREELAEFEAVALPHDPRHAARPDPRSDALPANDAARQAIEEEFGDLLFVMANVARHLAIDPETALRHANQKFVRRFGYVERRLAERGRTPAESTLAEMDALWDEIRAHERGG